MAGQVHGRARPPLMMKSGADRAHCFSQDRSSSIQITKSARPAHTLNTREGVTTDDGPSRIDAEHDSAEGPLPTVALVTAITFGSLGCPMTRSNSPTSEIKPPVDYLFCAEVRMAAPITPGNITGRSVNLPQGIRNYLGGNAMVATLHRFLAADVSCGWNRILYQWGLSTMASITDTVNLAFGPGTNI
jgi:hypothetical protein